MLGKLLKHELRATARIMLPVYILLLVSAGLYALTMSLAENYDILVLRIFLALISAVFSITMIGAGVVTLVLMVYRFYKNYMTDEGYLMFTLPATVGQLVWSKLLTAFLWSVCSTVAVIAAGAVAYSHSLARGDLSFFFEYYGGQLREALSVFTAGQWVLFGVELLVASALGVLASYLMFYAAIALGHSFSNHKVLLSVVFYFAFSFGLQTVGSVVGVFGIVYLDSSNALFNIPEDPSVIVHTILGSAMAMYLFLAAVFYVVTHLLLKKRLNLA